MKSKLFSLIALISLWGSLSQAAILPAGSLDPMFGTDKTGKIRIVQDLESDIVNDSVVQPDGKIVVVGSSKVGTDKNFLVARFNPNGTLDTTFGTPAEGGKVSVNFSGHSLVGNLAGDDEATAVTLDGNKILVTGYVTTSNGNKKDIILARFNADGSRDTDFVNKQEITVFGFGNDDIPTAIAIQANQKIIVVGREVFDETDEDIWVIHYDLNGIIQNSEAKILDLAINGNNVDIPHSVQIQADGKIAIAGSASNFPFLLRLNENLSRDNAFSSVNHRQADPGEDGLYLLESQGEFTSLIIQQDGKMLAGGFLGNTEDTRDFLLFRCNDNNCSDPDSTFGTNGVTTTNINISENNRVPSRDELYSLVLQADGKILGGGVSYTLPGSIDFSLARYTNDGKLDLSFSEDGKTTTGFSENNQNLISGISRLKIQSNGRILAIGGTINSSKSEIAFARYMSESTEVPDSFLGINPNTGGGCSVAPFGNTNLFSFLIWLIPLGFFGWRRTRK